jgi:hypothetical protein
MIILIDGFWGSGKTVLRSLLDGHTELKVSPSQESIISSFKRNYKKSKFFDYKDLRLIREFLIDSYYYNLEHETKNGYLDSDLKKEKINFDFYDFEKYWTEKLQQEKEWDNEKILNIIYSSIIKYYYNCEDIPIKEKKVIMEDNSFYCHEFFLNTFKDSKIIIVEKNMPDIIASLVKREESKLDYKSEGYKNFNFNFLVRKQHFPIQIKNSYIKAVELKNNFKERVYICNFKNLILNTTEEMKIISNFIGIDYEKILSEPTHFAKQITFKDNHNVINKEKNSAINTFSKYQISLLNQFEKNFPRYNFLSLSIFDFISIKFFYSIKLFLKNIIKFFVKFK